MASGLEALAVPSRRSVGQWLRRHLFDGPWNTALTLAAAALLLRVIPPAVRWARHAHWAVVTDNPRFWLLGPMPLEYVGRAYWAGGLTVCAVALTAVGLRVGVRPARLVALWVGVAFGALWVMSPVRMDHIGGLYLTLLLAVTAITASFPLGVLIGMGRVSRLPVIRAAAVLYIEVIRGVPFITVLLWFSVFVTLVSGDALGRVQRAMIAMTVFTAAYVAEIVRGGIEAVPRGQVEAARALGLSAGQTMLRIVLPQAVKVMIPALVGQFISLFKDTSLAVIIGLSELVGAGRALLARAEYLHDVREVYVFLLIVYFIGSYVLSSASRRLERRLGLGER